MKNLIVIVIALCSLNATGQGEKQRMRNHRAKMDLQKDMTPADIASIKTKKLTLRLDLTERQADEVYTVLLEKSETTKEYREAHKPKDSPTSHDLSKDELLKRQNHRLDQQIDTMRKMKAILTTEQYETFKKHKPRKHRDERRHQKGK